MIGFRLSLIGFIFISFLAIPTLANQEINTFRKLIKDQSFREKLARQIEQQTSENVPQDTRLLFNLEPRNSKWRNRLYDLLLSRADQPKIRLKELYYYQLLNLNKNPQVQRTLAQLLYQKHGKYPVSALKKNYSKLNKAFDTWDQRKYPQALNLFRQVRLQQSNELTAILAYHLRDNGQIAEAKKLLETYKPDPQGPFKPDHLNWIPEMYQEIIFAEKDLSSTSPQRQIKAQITLGKLNQAQANLSKLNNSPYQALYQAKILEKQSQYHDAAKNYLKYYQQKWQSKYPEFTPMVYKAQLEDVNSIDLIALKFRTSPELIKVVNERPYNWIETYRMLIIPTIQHDLKWPTNGDYVSSHFGYRLHPLTGTWKLHEGIDIETRKGYKAYASASGQVTRSNFDRACGNTFVIKYKPTIDLVYCHAESFIARKGQRVSTGQPVTVTGTTGSSGSIHLHFGVKINGRFVDPMDWL